MAVGNNGSRMIGNTEFYGGLSTDRKIGIENSYFDGECLDVRKSPSQMTVLPMARTLPDSDAVTGLMTAMTQSKDGNIWGVDEKGRLYKIDEDNAIIPITPSGKNLCNFGTQTFTGYQLFTLSSSLPAGTYTFSAQVTTTDTQSDTCYVRFMNGQSTTTGDARIVHSENRTYVTITTNNTTDGVYLYAGYNAVQSQGDTATFTDMQIEVGSTATSYEPYVLPEDRDKYSWSSGFSLESFDIDDGLWWADAGHKLFSYGKVLNPTGATRATNSFELLTDNSPRVRFGIELIQNEDQVVWNSNQDIPRSGGSETCSVGTTISEDIVTEYGSAGVRKYAGMYLPGRIPIAKIGIRFMTKGAGNVRLVIHDENDNVVATSSAIEATNVSTDGYTEFIVRPDPTTDLSASNQFTVRPWAGDTMELGEVLHIHIVASSSGYTVKTSVADDMGLTLDFTSTAYVLHETFNKKHPMVTRDKLYIGNGRYVSTKESTPLNQIDDNLFIQDALRLDDGFEVCSFGTSDEYLIIGAEKYSAGSTRGFQAGRLYFWDMDTEGYNFYIDCNMGSPKCIFNFGNIVYIIIAGALYAYTGGKELVKVRTLKGTDTEYSGRTSVTEVYPNMMTIRREILMIAFPSNTTAYSIRHGVYAFGSIDKNYPNCFTYNYKIPGATTDDTLEQYNSDGQHFRIGCVYNFNDTLFYSYEVTTTLEGYTTTRVALAVVDNDSGTSTSYKWESLQYDAGSPAFQKMALRVGIYFDPLPDNTTITPKYRIDDGEWVMGPATATAGDRYITCEINQRFHELQYGLEGTTGNDLLTPVIKQVSAEIRVLNEEAKL